MIQRTPLSATAPAAAAPEQSRALEAYRQGDYPSAFEFWERQARDGDGWSQFCLAVMHQKGQATKRNAESARQWYRMAAAQGHLAAVKFLKKQGV